MNLKHNNTTLSIDYVGNIEINDSGNYTDAAYALLSYILDLNSTILSSIGYGKHLIGGSLYVNVKTLELSFQEYLYRGTPASFYLLKEQYDKLLALRNFV